MNLTRVFLYAAIAAPFCYFLIQLIAAPFYPNYDFIRIAASDLGSPVSSFPALFNIGAMFGGLVMVLGAYGFWRGFQNTRTSRVLVWLLCLAVVLVGFSSLWAGIYPLPDQRHAENPFALFGLLPMPFLIATAFWANAKARVWLILPVLFLLVLMPVMSGAIAIDRAAYDGLLQRLLAMATYTPIAIGAILRMQQP
jgi:hypothetical membrane protein